MNIVYASDNNYADILGVSILSLFENNKEENINLFILDNEISIQNKDKLLIISEIYSRKITFIRIPNIENIMQLKLDDKGYSITSFARLFVSSFLPKSIDKIIYLDCDTMIRSSLLPLWNENLNGNVLGGVLDFLSKLHKKYIFLESKNPYVNSGVLVIDLKKCRNYNVEDKVIKFTRLFNGILKYPDQDIINGCLSTHIKCLHPKYNYMCFYRWYNRKQFVKMTGITDFYNDYIFSEAISNPTIVHFISPDNRPWIKGNVNFFQDEYITYRNMTPWCNLPLREAKMENDNIIKKSLKKILQGLPTPIYEKYKDCRNFIAYSKNTYYSRKKLKKSDIKLEDCYIQIKENSSNENSGGGII